MSAEDDLLFANSTYYVAFNARDPEQMDRLWAQQAPVACIHPQRPALTGRDKVLASFRAIMKMAELPKVECRQPQAFIHGDSGFVVCYEVLGRNAYVATNIFVREDDAWRMVLHQAGGLTLPQTGRSDGGSGEAAGGQTAGNA
jgi:hypothetical protein